MADNTTLNAGTGGDVIATDDVSGVKYQRVKLVDGTLDSTTAIPGDATNGLDVDVTRVQGTVAVTDNSGSLTIDQGSETTDGATGLPSKALVVAGYDGTNTQVIVTDSAGRPQVGVNGTVTVTGALTDTQLRATAVPVSGPLTDTQLRATAVPVADGGGSLTVDAASLPLPTGASTAAKQPALGTAGAASADVLSVQGVASMTALKTDGSGVTQPVSGTVTANAGSGPWPVTDNSGSLTVDAPVGTPVFTTVTPSTSGGWSKTKFAAQTTTVQTVKGSAGTFGGYYVYNPNTSVAYVQVFDVSGAVTLGTTAPDMTFGIPPGSGANLEVTNGVNMANAIKLACTTTATGLSAPSTGLDLTVFFK